jgi:hypothetical protein
MYAWLQNLFDENTHGDALFIPNKTLFLSLSCNVNLRAFDSNKGVTSVDSKTQHSLTHCNYVSTSVSTARK